MQTIEIMIYIAVAILIGSLTLFAIGSLDYNRQYSDFISVFRGGGAAYKIESGQFAQELAKRWEACRLGMDNLSSSVYVEDNGSLERDKIITDLKRLGKCDIIDCWNRTNSLLLPEIIYIPKVINIRCGNSTLIVG